MAENILRAVITADAPGVKETFDGIGESVKKTGESFQKAGHTITSSSQQARFAVVDIGHALRDLPFALQNPILLSGPIDHLTQALTTLKQTSGTTGGAIQALKDSLTGGGGLMIGITLITTVLTLLSRGLFDTKSAADESKIAFEALNAELKVSKKAMDDFTKSMEDTLALAKLQVDINFKPGFENDLIKLRQEFINTQEETKRFGDEWNALAEKLRKLPLEAPDEQKKAIREAAEAAEDKLKVSVQKETELASKIRSLRATNTREQTAKDLEEYKKFLKEQERLLEEAHKRFRAIWQDDKIKVGLILSDKDIHDNAQDLQKRLEDEMAKHPIDLSQSLRPVSFSQQIIKNAITAQNDATQRAAKLAGELDDRLRKVAATVSDAVTPAFQDMFSAIVSGENPLKAFFKGIEQAIFQVIQDLIAAAIKAAILKLIIGVGTGGAAPGAIPGIWSGTMGSANPGGFKGISGALSGGLQLSGVLRGNDIYVSSQRAAASLGRQG